MAAEWITNLVAIIGALLGIGLVTGIPYVQKQIKRGKDLEALTEIRPDLLTEEQRWEKEKLERPFRFSQYYVWTAVGSFIFAITAVLSQVNALFSQTANMTDWTMVFVTGIVWGIAGNWGANQLDKSETTRGVISSMTGSTSGNATVALKKVKDKIVDPDPKSIPEDAPSTATEGTGGLDADSQLAAKEGKFDPVKDEDKVPIG